MQALWYVPENFDASVTTTALSPAAATSANSLSKAAGVAWLVVGSSSLSTSRS